METLRHKVFQGYMIKIDIIRMKDEILFKFTGRSELETKNLRTELRNNCYCNIFLNSNNKDFLLAIMEDGVSHDVNE